MIRRLSILAHTFQQAFSDPLRRLALSVALLVLLNLFGTAMYMWLEGWDFVDSLYMTVITIATVGFGEVRGGLSTEGRIFTIVLIYLGVGLATTAISNAVSLALGPLLWDTLQQRRMRSMIDKLKDHYIVCGFGRMGAQIVRDLRARDEKFVVVDANPEVEELLQEEKIPYFIEDATEDEILLAAGIERAQGVVAALGSDPANLMMVLTARELNPNLFIVARVVRPESESKLRRAGANRVINPYQIGGHRIALSLLRPAVHDFMDHIFHFGEGREIDIGQLHVAPGSAYDGKTIAESGLRDDHNVSILAIREPNGQISITPNPTAVIQSNAELIIIGPPQSIYRLEREHIRR